MDYIQIIKTHFFFNVDLKPIKWIISINLTIENNYTTSNPWIRRKNVWLVSVL